MNYTLAVTSCNRFDLLKQTLESFAATADIAPTTTIIVDDSDAKMPEWLRGFPGLGRILWLSNGRRRGQMFTLDRLYDHVKTELVFHCEDDWLFKKATYLGGYINTSFTILEMYPDIWTVSLRGADCNGHPVIQDPRWECSINEPGWKGGWGGCHFNPGARRLSDYRRIGSYGRHVGYGIHGCGTELALSKTHLAMGYVIAAAPKCIDHLGHGKSKAIEPLPPQPRVLIAVPAAQQYDYGQHHLRVPRVTDGRIEAVRETWFQDVGVFPNVDAKFFYGQPVKDACPTDDGIYVNAPDDYSSLSAKVKEVCRYALLKGYDYLVKCDDDTVIYVDRLLRSGFDSVDQMGYFGCDHQPGRCSCYATGMCYTLSRRCMELIVQAPITHWAEDLWVGSVLRANGIRPVHNPGWRPGFDKHYVDFPLPDGVVAAHSVKPDDMRTWYSSLTQLGRVETPDGYPGKCQECGLQTRLVHTTDICTECLNRLSHTPIKKEKTPCDTLPELPSPWL